MSTTRFARLFAATALVGLLGLAAQPSQASLLGFYNFDTFNGTTLADLSGNGNNGTLSSNVPTLITGAAAYQGSSYQFSSGSNQTIMLPIDINASLNPQITMGGWFKSSGVTSLQALLSHDNGGFDRALEIDTRGGGGVTYSAFASSGVLGGASVVPDQWTFVSMRHDQNTGVLTLDVDGVRFTRNSVFYGSGTSNLLIAGSPGFTELFSGAVDNVFVYNEVVSDARILEIRQQGAAAFPSATTAPEPGTLGMIVPGLIAGVGLIRRRKTAK